MLSTEIGSPFSPALQTVIDRALDPLHGLLTELSEERPSRQTAHIRIVRARLAPPAYFRDNAPSPVQTAEDGCGAAFDRERAYWSAIGEAVERYAGSLYWPDSLTTGAAHDVSTALSLEPLIVSGRPEIQPFSYAHIYHWVAGRDLNNGSIVQIPAAMVYLGYRPTAPHEILVQNDSTGLACGISFEDACLRALCEVIERDAFAASWLLDRQPPRLVLSDADLATLSTHVQSVLCQDDHQINLFYLAKSFGVHAVTAIMHGDRAMCSIGAAAAPSLIQAIEKAVAEALQGWIAISAFPITDTPLSLDDLKTPFDHLRFYLHPERQPILMTYFSGAETINFADIGGEANQTDLPAILRQLTAAGYNAAATDLTTTDISDLGFSVVRVVVPGLQPLIFGPSCSCVVDDRRLQAWQNIWEVPAASVPIYNPWPHPFP